MFLLHVDISENGFNTIFWKFNRSVTKLEDADEIRSFDGILKVMEAHAALKEFPGAAQAPLLLLLVTAWLSPALSQFLNIFPTAHMMFNYFFKLSKVLV